MIGLGESYFSAYAIFLGANNFQMGLLTSLPPFLGGVSQFRTVSLMRKVPSRKKLVCMGVFLQALSLVPLILAFYLPVLRIEVYIALVCAYFTCNALIGPVWNSWMGDLVKSSQRSIYFGKRNRVITIGAFVAMTAAGITLRYFKDLQMEFIGFVAIFGLAFVARIFSFLNLARKFDPPQTLPVQDPRGFFGFMRDLPRKNHGRLVMYMSLVNFAVFISAAYFTPLMLKEYHFDYVTYTLVISGTAFAKFLSFSMWGELCDKLGARRVLRACGFMMAFVTLPWLFTREPMLLFLAQCYTGFVWAGYELSTFTFLLDATEPEERAQVSSYMHALGATAGLLGGLIGALMFVHTPHSWASALGRSLGSGVPSPLPPGFNGLSISDFGELLQFGLGDASRPGLASSLGSGFAHLLSTGLSHPLLPYFVVFALSGIIRFIAYWRLGTQLQEVRVIAPVRTSEILFKASGFKSAMGLTSRVVFFARRPAAGLARRLVSDEKTLPPLTRAEVQGATPKENPAAAAQDPDTNIKTG
jgi:predicted MFS family arabinose efflux permease